MRLEAFLRGAAARLAGSDTPHLDMRLLAKAALGLSDADLILATDRSLTAVEMARLESSIQRRLRGESVAHIVGEKEFYGLRLALAPGVLSPRPDTETLIEAAARRLDRDAPLSILDLGTGSGAILCALLGVFRSAWGLGVDLRFEAAASARANATRLGFGSRAAFICGDWADAVYGRFDLIVSNPPYIRSGDLPRLAPEVGLFEDRRALVGGDDGLDAYRRILPMAERLVDARGLMVLEFGENQRADLVQLASESFPDRPLSVENDLTGRPRALVIEKNI